MRPVDAAMLATGAALLEAARSVQAYGLAAAHLGLEQPLVVISVGSDPSRRDYRVLYNPEVVLAAAETAMGAEGSVSLPGIEVTVARATWVDVAFDDAGAGRQTVRFDDFVARVAQHEIDQVNGIFFLQRLSRLKREAALRRWKKQPL